MNTLLVSIFFMKGPGKELEKTREKLVQMLNIRSVIVQFFEQVFLDSLAVFISIQSSRMLGRCEYYSGREYYTEGFALKEGPTSQVFPTS